jgi:hypothetical protein
MRHTRHPSLARPRLGFWCNPIRAPRCGRTASAAIGGVRPKACPTSPPIGAEAPCLGWEPRYGQHQNNQPSRRKKGGGFGRPPWARYRDDRAGGARRGPGTSARYRSSARFNRRHARHKPRRFAALLVPPLCTGRTVALVSGPPAPQRAHPSSCPPLGAVPRRNAGPSPPSNRNSLMRALSRTRSRAHPRSARCATKTPAAHSRGRPGIGEM